MRRIRVLNHTGLASHSRYTVFNSCISTFAWNLGQLVKYLASSGTGRTLDSSRNVYNTYFKRNVFKYYSTIFSQNVLKFSL